MIGWLTGEERAFSGRHQDERKQIIKQKLMVSSWLVFPMLFAANFVRDYFHLGPGLMLPLRYLEGFYLVWALISFFPIQQLENENLRLGIRHSEKSRTCEAR
ncbi:hypothetical protein NIE88_16600 [Sporolactobacillus shoreicorticis]|uniref:Uncharacterized protein n=1 Tax=Sporolactobacillus shoreicorticis TaxID=1923877 RepID=A0ABW5S4M6_9BACL|nr:hypothetical protein [Sporolactobacillus shoreicorticis]MCO7127390.1 hypothetical protein [Sporolactobacillus shoreicorticis]